MAKFNLPLHEINSALDKFSWQTWTPSYNGSPSTPSATINYARYFQLGKQVYYMVDFSINSTVSGAGAFSFFFLMPNAVNENDSDPVGIGREINATGDYLMVNKNGTFPQNRVLVTSYDLSSILISGYRLTLTGTYRTN